MKKMQFALLAAIVCLCASPFATAQSIKVNWRVKAPFSDYKTFAWTPNQQPGFYRQFVRQYVDAALAKKGLSEIKDPKTADVKVVYHFKTQDVIDATTTSDGFGFGGGPWGGWGGYGGWGGWGDGMGMGMGMGGDGMATTQERPRTIGILTVDLVDSKSNEVIWRGQATEDSVASSQKGDEKQVQKSVDKMFDQYPPKGTR